MNRLKCNTCGTIWDSGGVRPMCPHCLSKQWLSSLGMITPKHDPLNLPSASPNFRSVVPHELREHPEGYYSTIANCATAVWSNKHCGYCYVWGVSPTMSGGSAVPKWSAMPTYPLDGYLVADPFGGKPHIFCEDTKRIQSNLTNGEYELPLICSVHGCNTPRMPGMLFCVKHTNPAKAEEAKDE